MRFTALVLTAFFLGTTIAAPLPSSNDLFVFILYCKATPPFSLTVHPFPPFIHNRKHPFGPSENPLEPPFNPNNNSTVPHAPPSQAVRSSQSTAKPPQDVLNPSALPNLSPFPSQSPSPSQSQAAKSCPSTARPPQAARSSNVLPNPFPSPSPSPSQAARSCPSTAKPQQDVLSPSARQWRSHSLRPHQDWSKSNARPCRNPSRGGKSCRSIARLRRDVRNHECMARVFETYSDGFFVDYEGGLVVADDSV
jgi:hypothetical protein